MSPWSLGRPFSQYIHQHRVAQAIRYLQQAQMIYGPYALIPDTNQMYEDAIQALVANDLCWQYERRRRGQHTCAHSEPLGTQASMDAWTLVDPASFSTKFLGANTFFSRAFQPKFSEHRNNPKTAGGNIYALRADNGRIIWQKNFGFNDIPIMAVDNGIVYVTSVVPPDETLNALRPGDGSTLWSKSLDGL